MSNILFIFSPLNGLKQTSNRKRINKEQEEEKNRRLVRADIKFIYSKCKLHVYATNNMILEIYVQNENHLYFPLP